MFDDFDPSLFNDPDFKEDSVREEIIVPIIKRLGYKTSGANKIVRSKSLLHPFVMIGSKKHPVHIIPDYLLYSDGRPGVILDAKRPKEALVESHHAEQAYSYAIHPEVRVRFYALCNGNQLVAYDVQAISPILVVDFNDIERDWDLIASILSPRNVSFAAEMHFDPDFGTAILKLGAKTGSTATFPFVEFRQFMQVHEDLFTMSVGIPVDDIDHLASFDASREILHRILEFTDKENRDQILKLNGAGQMVTALRPVFVSLDTVVGEPTRGQHDVFVPLIIKNSSELDEDTYRAAESLGSPCTKQ